MTKQELIESLQDTTVYGDGLTVINGTLIKVRYDYCEEDETLNFDECALSIFDITELDELLENENLNGGEFSTTQFSEKLGEYVSVNAWWDRVEDWHLEEMGYEIAS